jgi:membrane protein implicated in regulation of membrane protease activity
MASGSDWLANLFLYTFVFGLIFTVVSLLLGGVHIGSFGGGHGHVGHFGGLGHGHGHVHIGGGHDGIGHKADIHVGGNHSGNGDTSSTDGIGVLNMPTIMAFLTWFGGAGYIFSRTLGFSNLILVPMALASGLFGGTIMFILLSRLLWPMMSKPMNRADFALPGTPARVVSPIRAGGVGEIVYSKAGSRFTAGARNVDEQPIAQGTEVVIIKYEHGIAYVQPVESLLNIKGGA